MVSGWWFVVGGWYLLVRCMALHHLPRMPIEIPLLEEEVVVVVAGVVAGVGYPTGRGTGLARFTANDRVIAVGVVGGGSVVDGSVVGRNGGRDGSRGRGRGRGGDRRKTHEGSLS